MAAAMAIFWPRRGIMSDTNPASHPKRPAIRRSAPPGSVFASHHSFATSGPQLTIWSKSSRSSGSPLR